MNKDQHVWGVLRVLLGKSTSILEVMEAPDEERRDGISCGFEEDGLEVQCPGETTEEAVCSSFILHLANI